MFEKSEQHEIVKIECPTEKREEKKLRWKAIYGVHVATRICPEPQEIAAIVHAATGVSELLHVELEQLQSVPLVQQRMPVQLSVALEDEVEQSQYEVDTLHPNESQRHVVPIAGHFVSAQHSAFRIVLGEHFV